MNTISSIIGYSAFVDDDRLPVFSYHITRGVLVIIDENIKGRPSVTNRANDVLAYIYSIDPMLSQLDIIYRDSTGTYDGLELIDGQFVGFHPLQAIDENEAINKLRSVLS